MPAMILSWIFGLILISIIGLENILTLWLKLKLILITLLTIYHFYLGKLLNDFKLDQNTKSSKFFRIINEVPTILLILVVFIVFLVWKVSFIKPFVGLNVAKWTTFLSFLTFLYITYYVLVHLPIID